MNVAAVVPASSDPGFELPAGWEKVMCRAPRMAATMSTYLQWLSGRLDPRSVEAAELCLRQFATYVTAADRSCPSAAKVTAGHVADWEAALSARDASAGERTVSAKTIDYKLATVRRFFERIRVWGEADSPAENPVARRPRPPRPPRPKKPGKPKPPSRAFPVELTWAQIADRAPQMADTMCAYLEQLTVLHRRSSVNAAALALRHLAAHLISADPPCLAVGEVERSHIQSYKLALKARPGRKGPSPIRPSATTCRT